MRLIDGDVLMPKLKFIQEAEHQIYGKESWGFASKCITAIENAPTIEPERKTGKWGKYGECPFCYYIRKWEDDRFCGNCGARMLREGETE